MSDPSLFPLDPPFQLLAQLGSVLREFPELPLWEALSAGQVRSKQWLIEELEKAAVPLGTVFVLGAWWGMLPAMMFARGMAVEKIRSFDIDPTCAPVAETLNRPYVMDNWRFKASTADMLAIDYSSCEFSTKRRDGSEVRLVESPDTVVNTSCEHLAGGIVPWLERIPKGKLLVLQSNNFSSAKGHCNCVGSLAEFHEQAALAEVLYAGELPLPDYNRFMLIGYR